MDKPGEWTEIAGKLTPLQCGFKGGSDLGWYGTRDAIAAALTAAHGAGRKVGLKRAAGAATSVRDDVLRSHGDTVFTVNDVLGVIDSILEAVAAGEVTR